MRESVIARGIASQMLAGLAMLKDCVDRCPAGEWGESHGDYPFSQVVFHALFDLDYSLSESLEAFKAQAFHADNAAIFADYEELGDGPRRRLYERRFVEGYHEHCREKVRSLEQAAADAALTVPDGDIYGNMTRLERSINAIRHLQHHAAQLGLRLQLLSGQEMAWISRGIPR